MSLLGLTLAYLRQRPVAALLSGLLLALGVATVVALLLFGAQMQDRLTRDAKGIELVVGAKGSPLQLVLSAVYHADIPTGNILLKDAKPLLAHPQVRQAIPLALGDSVQGVRIVGTDHRYPAHYGAMLADGKLWEAPFEAVLGATAASRLALAVGDSFESVHGLVPGGPGHEEVYQVVGTLAPTGTVVDRLALTSIESVWAVHEEHDGAHEAGEEHAEHDRGEEHETHEHDEEHAEHEPDEEHEAHEHDEEEHAEHDEEEREITALLLAFKSPVAALTLPRAINQTTPMMAASPAFESARLFALMGVGLDVLRGFGALLIVSAGLGVLVAMGNALERRQGDLALLRCLGAPRRWILGQLLLEGLLLTGAGLVLGLILGHGAVELLGRSLPQARDLGLTGALFLWSELWLALGALALGALAALPAAWRAYRSDVARALALG